MQLTAREIAAQFGGEVVGNPDVKVSSPARIEQGRPGTICFFANPKYEHYVYSSKADIILVNRDFEPSSPVAATLVKVDDAYAAVARLLSWFNSAKVRGNRFFARFFSTSIHISPSARVGRGTHIYPQVYLGPKVKVGRGCIIYPGVKIYKGCVIGDNCIIHSNAVIGADGFGFAPCPDGSYTKIPQLGNVVIGNNVEIGANTTVDRATMDSTVVHDGVKIDNLCQIAHNVEIGDNTVIAALSGVAGSAKIGRQCMIGGQCGISGHIKIADNTKIAGGSGVIGNIRQEGKVLMGYPAIDHMQYMRAYAAFKANGGH